MEPIKATTELAASSQDGVPQPLSRQQKRLLRQKKAKLHKRAAGEDSSHSKAAEDPASEQAYEQLLHKLREHHPQPVAAAEASWHAPEQGREQAPKAAAADAGRKRRRRRRSSPLGAGNCDAAAGSLGSLGSAAALAVPSRPPAEALAPVSEVSTSEETQQEQEVAPALPLAAGCSVPGRQAHRAGEFSSGPAQQDWSASAAAMSQALMQRREGDVLGTAAAKAGLCRLDLSLTAMLIGSQLMNGSQAREPLGRAQQDGAAPPARAEGAQEAARPEGGPGAARRRRPAAVHGNYRRYYGYRYFGDQRPEDPRLQVFERAWFARRRCLDVGCNEGLVTLALAARFHTRSMLGVDVDSTLVARACRHLREARSAAEERERLSRHGGVSAEERREARGAAAALTQTAFVHGDFLDSEVAAASLDTITCLSVTKWVHLNRGDDGLRALFAAFARALAPGGLLVLEPQPWSSYRAAAGKVRRDEAPPGSFFHRQEELRLRPALFADHLCQQLGFSLVRQLGVEESAAGFNRPLLVLRKPTRQKRKADAGSALDG